MVLLPFGSQLIGKITHCNQKLTPQLLHSVVSWMVQLFPDINPNYVSDKRLVQTNLLILRDSVPWHYARHKASIL